MGSVTGCAESASNDLVDSGLVAALQRRVRRPRYVRLRRCDTQLCRSEPSPRGQEAAAARSTGPLVAPIIAPSRGGEIKTCVP